MTHTNEFLRGMFATYMGCECEITETQDNITTKTKAKSSGVVSERLHFAGAGLFVHFSKLKPILTPLSEITDEDAVEVGRVIGVIDEECPIEDLKYWGDYTKKSYLCKFLFSKDRSQQVIDYLRSPYRPDGTPKPVYDCGYMHIPSLISADLAISSKTN